MKETLTIFFLLFSLQLLHGQSDSTGNKITLDHHGLFVQYCLYSIAEKYQTKIEITPLNCFSLTIQELDSIQHENEKEINRLKASNGENWYTDFQNELEDCQRQLCPYDSLEKFYSRGIGGALSLNFPESQNFLNIKHACILKYTLVPLLITVDSLRIEIVSHSTPDELEDVSIDRAMACTEYLIIEGIDRERIRVVDHKAKLPLTFDPSDVNNRRITFRVTTD
ncbi:MAG: hypothetical protein IIA45_08895 [Bacteroidetes bacterium]|nr:hypothetical protein [Bacteroidota bacterium]